MATAGAELATLVNTQILAKGAKAVTVINVPDMAKTPFALSQSAATQALINQMVTTFNSQLKAKLSTSSAVLHIDAYTTSREQFANPAYYGLTSVTLPACDLTPQKNALGSSLVCNKGNLIPGVVTYYQFADAVHPTPYGHSLLAYAVAKAMFTRKAGCKNRCLRHVAGLLQQAGLRQGAHSEQKTAVPQPPNGR